MAFANIGAAGALTAAANIAPAGQYASAINGPALAAGPFFQKTGASGEEERIAGSDRRSRLNHLRITAAGGALLTDFVATPAAAANADTGVFVTAAAAANQHGLPANFGPGRGKWRADDFSQLAVQIISAEQGGDGRVSTSALSIQYAFVAGGDISITIHNSGLAAGANDLPDGSSVVIHYFEDN